MTYTQRLLLVLALAFVPLASACDNPFDNSCPEGYWRPRAMEECVPLPVSDAGQDSGPVVMQDAGTDAGAATDAGSTTDAGLTDAGLTDAATSTDAATATDAATPDSGLVP